jgi:hypothetical protein
VEAQQNQNCVAAWMDYLRDEPPPVVWRLGAGRSRSGQVDRALPPLAFMADLRGQSRRVELSGDLKAQLGGSLFLERNEPPTPARFGRLRQKALAAYLDHLVLACVDEGHGDHRARFVFEKEKPGGKGMAATREIRFRFPALSKDEAAGRLRAWVEDLLTGDHAVLLPIEAALEVWGEGPLTADGIQDFLDSEIEGGQRGFISTLTGPVPDPMRFAPPQDPQEIVHRRLRPFLDLVCDFRFLEKV